jgi:hypothetical protein
MGAVFAIEGDNSTGVEMGGVVAETTTDVSDLSLDFEIETPHVMAPEDRALVKLIVIVGNTNAQNITVTLVTDAGNVAAGTWSTAAGTKERDEFPVAKPCRIFGVRLTSATPLTTRIEVSSVEVEWE